MYCLKNPKLLELLTLIVELLKKMSIVLPFKDILIVEELSRDILLSYIIAMQGTCTFSRKSSRFYSGVMERSVTIQKEYHESQ